LPSHENDSENEERKTDRQESTATRDSEYQKGETDDQKGNADASTHCRDYFTGGRYEEESLDRFRSHTLQRVCCNAVSGRIFVFAPTQPPQAAWSGITPACE
jgi:hypothetical protein